MIYFSEKLPTIRSKTLLKVDASRSRLHIDFIVYLNLLMVEFGFSKWPDICKCKEPTSSTTTNFLHEPFARFGVPDTIQSDNGNQFVPFEFKNVL